MNSGNPIFTPIHRMTEAQLQSRVDFHCELSALYGARGMDTTARSFRNLADDYRLELARRIKAPVSDDGWDDPDR